MEVIGCKVFYFTFHCPLDPYKVHDKFHHMPKLLLRSCIALFLFLPSFISFAQSKSDAYVPCQEMPDIIQNYNADYRALARYYSPASNNPGGFGRGLDASAGSPDKRQDWKT